MTWYPDSPMWWHRSAGHRALVLIGVVLFYVVAFPALIAFVVGLLGLSGG